MADKGSRRRQVKVDKGLRFYHEILGLDHLQYGLWDDEPRNLDGLKSAQERYARTLHDWIPEGVKTILDVGCGTGASAARLLELGYRVEGLSPDPYQKQLVASRTGMPFHLARLQEFRPEKTYDLAMMSESSQYIWIEVLFAKVVAVAAGGHLLIADYFIDVDEPGLPVSSGHPLAAFLEQAERHGFELLRREDVTDRVLPTLDVAREFLERYVYPSADLLVELASQDLPRLTRVVEWLVKKFAGKELAKVKYMIDSAEFKRTKKYLFLLFRVPQAPFLSGEETLRGNAGRRPQR
jgi:SAM-dependent methyltransferase